MRTDWLIVGAGFTGCTLAERIASQLGQTVILLDRRAQIGGNAADEPDEHGILVHRYGPHIFHTNSTKVWDYLSFFTKWRRYEHRVLASLESKKVPMPFNLNSLEACFPPARAAALARTLLAEYGGGAKVPLLRMRASANPEIRELADFVYDTFFYGYTVKQWGLAPEQLDPLVTGRVPIRLNRDNRYFEDVYQAVPSPSYHDMFRRMLDHPRIRVLLDQDYRRMCGHMKFNRLIYTGPIDEFFDYIHGPLPYRSLRFTFTTLPQEQFQDVGTVNYPNGQGHTRITEQKYISGQTHAKTTLVTEYPEPHRPGANEPYYPVPRAENHERYQAYANEAAKLNGTVLFAGRLGDYRYYNMDQAVGRALHLFKDIADGQGSLRGCSDL